VLTVDPTLQAYRTDRVSGADPMCPRPGGDLICDEVGYQAWFTLGPPGANAAAATTDEGGSSSGLIIGIVVVVVVLGVIAFIVIRRRRASREAIEV
jgi:peptide/nickel transport system substrate-binding protein